MALDDYRRKRRFGSTPEPEGGTRRGPARPMFVVQLHHASRRHYDFRLQVGDTLKSWAVPKGPSFDPKVKRMAVEVEDHPLEYAGFEGNIPKGNYGGGHVARFDAGTWTTEGDVQAQLAKGHLRFELHGQRLKGGWHLVRSGKPARQPQWLLFKQEDAWASTVEADDLLDGVVPPPDEAALGASRPAAKAPGKKAAAASGATRVKARSAAPPHADLVKQAAALPGARKRALASAAPEPQLARLYASPPEGEGWLHELKWDGYRLLATIRDGQVALWSRNGIEWTERVPEVRDALLSLGLQAATLDGELIAGQGRREDFNLLQQVLSGERQGQLRYAMFDLMHLGGVDLSAAPLLARKELLEKVLQAPPAHLAFSSHSAGSAADAFHAAQEAGFEGIISKRADAAYRGGRGDDWRKSKAQASEEFAVVGYTPPKGSRRGVGALLLATPDPTHGWRYAGRIGSGFSDAQLQALGEQLQGRGSSEPSVYMPDHDTDLRAAMWLPEPAFVVEVFTRGTGGRGLLRQASFKALRPDKDVDALTDRDVPEKSRNTGTDMATSTRSKSSRKTPPAARAAPELSSPDKILYPDDGITKRQVADYYTAVMEWLLPEIAGRPLSLVRCPGGLRAPCFFQKHATPGMALVSALPIRESDGGSEDYLAVSDAASVMELVQFNSLEFHPWGSRAETLEAADRLVFDLDPDEAVAWRDVVAAARQLRDYLTQAGLQSFVRTSGGKGLHLVVPLAPPAPWPQARAFSQAVAEAARDLDPLRFIATASKAKRKGKIFIDWLRNGRGSTSVASFSLRARPGAPVAMPLRWEELGRVKSGHAFDIHNTPARLKRLKSHPWAGIDAVTQSLPG